jgi:hypothetical protein
MAKPKRQNTDYKINQHAWLYIIVDIGEYLVTFHKKKKNDKQ